MKYFILIFLIIIVGCKSDQKNISFEEFESNFLNEMIFATKVEDLKLNNKIITRPIGLEQLVFWAEVPAIKGRAHQKMCFYHTVGFKEKKGEIKIAHTPNEYPCEDSLGNTGFDSELKDVKDLVVSFREFKLILSFNHNGNNKKIEIPLYNINEGSINQKYMEQSFKSLSSGLRLVSPLQVRQNYLGKITDRFSNLSAIKCQQVDEKCNTVGEYLCNQCKYGWYEVVDFKCPTGGSKFCGQNFCGEKNEPACPIGQNPSTDGDPGICHGDLTATLNADKIWVCQ